MTAHTDLLADFATPATLTTYRITSMTSGHCLGEFEATDEQDALDVMSRDVGYRDHAHACEVTDDDGLDLSVTEVTAE